MSVKRASNSKEMLEQGTHFTPALMMVSTIKDDLMDTAVKLRVSCFLSFFSLVVTAGQNDVW